MLVQFQFQRACKTRRDKADAIVVMVMVENPVMMRQMAGGTDERASKGKRAYIECMHLHQQGAARARLAW